MKKRYIAAIAMLCLCLVGCGEKKPVENPPSPEGVNRSASEQDGTVFGSPVRTQPVKSGSGSLIGKYAYADIRKSTIQKASYEEIKEEFEFIESFSDDYNYFYLYFEDETGILFAGCSPLVTEYGKITDGEIQNQKGISVEDLGGYYSLVDLDDKPLSDSEDPTGINGLDEALE